MIEIDVVKGKQVVFLVEATVTRLPVQARGVFDGVSTGCQRGVD